MTADEKRDVTVREPSELREKLASIIIPTLNAGEEFKRTLAAIRRQKIDGAFDLLIVDSGSRDHTVSYARKAGARVIEILPDEFDHGNTRNLGACVTMGEFIVFLSQDAVPQGEGWLDALLESLREDSRVAGAYSRVVPHPEADPMTARLVTSDINYRDERIVQESPGGREYRELHSHDRRLLVNFNDVASALRRTVWEKLPLPRCEFGEDLLWGKSVIEAGYRIVFENRSVVEHSHEYDHRTLYSRAWIDGKANRRILDRVCLESAVQVLTTAWRVAKEDRDAIRKGVGNRAGEGLPIGKIFSRRLVQMWGLYRGGRESVEMMPTPAPVTTTRMKILYVVHGFPPQTRAGTEVYTLNLAKEFAKKHEVVILHRLEAPGEENYSVLPEEEVEGLPVYRLVNNLAYQGIEDTFSNRHVEERFREFLDLVQPDLIHFQHCLHTSASLIEVAQKRGIPSLLTLHDYWFICPKVQLIQSTGKICPETRPGIGCVRCAANKTPLIRLGKTATFVFYPFLVVFLRFYPRMIRRFRFLEKRVILDLLALFRRRKTILGYLQQLDLMISPSPFLRKKYIRFGVPPERILMSRNGLDTEHLRGRRPTDSPRVRFAFMGSFVWYKGLQVLVEAFSKMEEGEAELHIHGDDRSTPDARAYRKRLEGLCAKETLVFHGPFRSEDLPGLYRDIDALVVPSVWFENAPMVIFEAFAAGVPVIASRLGGMANFVRHEVNGLLFRPGDPGDLAAVLDRCVRNRQLLVELGRGTPSVKSVQRNSKELEVYYRQCLSRADARSRAVPPARSEIEVGARRYDRKCGSVDNQGEDLVLLRPNGREPSKVSYRIESREGGTYRVELQTEVLRGESSVKIGGRVSVNGALLGAIPEHRYQAGAPLDRRFTFPCALQPGQNLLEIDNAHPVDPEGQYHVRLKRVKFLPHTVEVEG